MKNNYTSSASRMLGFWKASMAWNKNSKSWVDMILNSKLIRLGVLGSIATLSGSTVFAAEEQFNDALRAANAGDTSLLDQYQLSMQNDVLGYYPEYWKLNTNLTLQPSSAITNFAQRYPQSAMSEKLAADYVEEK